MSGILIGQAACSRLCITHLRARMPDLCVLPLEFIGSRGEKFGNGREKGKGGGGGERDGRLSRKSREIINEAKVTRTFSLATNLTSVDPGSLGPFNFPSTYRNLQTFRLSAAQARGYDRLLSLLVTVIVGCLLASLFNAHNARRGLLRGEDLV